MFYGLWLADPGRGHGSRGLRLRYLPLCLFGIWRARKDQQTTFLTLALSSKGPLFSNVTHSMEKARRATTVEKMVLLQVSKVSSLLPLLGLIINPGLVLAISPSAAGTNRILLSLVAPYFSYYKTLRTVEVVDGFSWVRRPSFSPWKHSTQPIRTNCGHIQSLAFSASSGMDNIEDQVDSLTVSSLLDPQETSLLETIWNTAFSSSEVTNDEDSVMERTLQSFLPQMSSSLLLKLRTNNFGNNPNRAKIQAIQRALSKTLDQKLQQSKDLLHTFLTSGEIRKLDGLIGKAARENRLDSSFFAVLNANIQDAYTEQTQGTANNSTSASNERLQILRHIDTRCQEEVEKHVAPPGLALLHKLLRTDVTAIRTNILRHYLGPQAATITTPDGQVIPLKSSSPSKALVTSTEFRTAIENAVAQIRQMEKVGGTDRTTAATMVESIRQTAKEARTILEESYGPGSEQIREFEMGLMPVFRPDRGSIYSPE